jgi:DNA replication protein DnaC
VSARVVTTELAAAIELDGHALAELVRTRFFGARRHVVLRGSVGVGPTSVAGAIVHLVREHGDDACFTRDADLVRTLRQSRLDSSRDVERIALSSVDVLALEPTTKREAATTTSSSSSAPVGCR